MVLEGLKLLRVDLSRGKISVEELGDDVARLFLGGKSLGYYLVYKLVPPGTDPLSPANVLVFSAGFFNTLVPGASKVSVVSKSPLTRLIHDSSAGDFFGPLLRRAGFNAVIVDGASRDPVYLWIRDGEAEIRSAEKLWGLDTRKATRLLREETRKDASVAVIGPAGERLVRIANIMFDEERAAGRGGLGAVMGSKRLKAIVVHGSGKPRVKDQEALERLGKEWYRHFSESPRYEDLRRYGTTNALVYSSQVGMSPSYNFRKPWVPLELAERLGGDEVKKREVDPPWFLHGKSCPVKCARYAKGKYKAWEFLVKPEYENLAMLGAATGVFELDPVLYFNRLVDDLGLDSISTGNVIAWFLELVEEGLVDPEDYGLEAKGFGDVEAVEKLIHLIAERKGIGAILAEGVARASQILGIGWERAVHVKGLEAPAWDPRGRRGLAVSYATADVGASHLRGWPRTRDPPSAGPAKEVVASMARSRDEDALMDTLGVCRFVSYPVEALAEFYRVITGEERSVDDLLLIPQRAEALSRIHAVLDHLTPPVDDDIPPRWMEPEPEGPLKGERAFIDERDKVEAIREYYRLRGWHPVLGVPLPETLARLGLEWAVRDAEKALQVAAERASRIGLEV